MKTYLIKVILPLAIFLFSNCTVQKRLYRKGWNVEKLECWKVRKLVIAEINTSEYIENQSENNFEEISEINNNSIAQLVPTLRDFIEDLSNTQTLNDFLTSRLNNSPTHRLNYFDDRIRSHSEEQSINSRHNKIIEPQKQVQKLSLKKLSNNKDPKLIGSIILSVLGVLILLIVLFVLVPAGNSLLGILVLFLGLLFLLVGISSLIVELIRFLMGKRKAR